MLVAIDPGSTSSAYVLLDGTWALPDRGKLENPALVELLRKMPGASATDPEAFQLSAPGDEHLLAIEDTKAYTLGFRGKSGDRQSFFPEQVRLTALWVGQFVAAYGGPHLLVDRRIVKRALLGTASGKDKDIRDALLHREEFGGTPALAQGRKAEPGPLYGVSGDMWAALAVAVTVRELGSKAGKTLHELCGLDAR